MEQNKNRVLLGIILLLCAICFVAMRLNWFQMKGLPYLLLGGALFLLYYTKQKNWALWGSMLFSGAWCWQLMHGLYAHSASIGGFFLLLPGFILLRKYKNTAWDGYVVPGCFFFWGGFYVLLSDFYRFAQRPCTTLVLCLFMVFYTAHKIRRNRNAIPLIFTKGLLLFAIASILFGVLC